MAARTALTDSRVMPMDGGDSSDPDLHMEEKICMFDDSCDLADETEDVVTCESCGTFGFYVYQSGCDCCHRDICFDCHKHAERQGAASVLCERCEAGCHDGASWHT